MDFSGFTSNGGFADLLSTQEAVISSGDGVDTHMKVLSVQGNATLRFDTTGDDCLNEPSLCPGGFAVSFWLKNERTYLYSASFPLFFEFFTFASLAIHSIAKSSVSDPVS